MITLEGYISKSIYSKGDFRIYSFFPLKKYHDLVKIHPQYGNISISGEMPDLYEETLYKIDVEHSKKGNYDNYTVKKIYRDNNNVDTNTTAKFLEAILSSKDAKEILKYYPDIIERVIKKKPIDTSKLFGIKEKKLNMIKTKIIENFQLIDLVDEYHEYGMTFGMIKNLYNSYSSIETIKKKMDENPYECLCKLNRVGFKTADGFIMQKFPHKKDSIMRATACINYILMENENNGNTWISLVDLYAKFKELAPESGKHFKEVIEKDDDIYFNSHSNRVSLRETRICESEVCNTIKRFKENNTILNIDYKKYNVVDDVPLTEEQMNTLKNVCQHNISILSGVGGSGKSFSVKALINMLEDNLITYMLISPTAKASKVLSEYCGRDASTIHRGLRYNPKEGFYYGLKNKLPFDVVIVDEYSMIDIYLLRDLLRAINEETTKIVFVGDPAQIPSVGVGNIAFDMLESQQIPTTLLTKVFRYNEGGLSYVATKIRQGEKYLNGDKSIQTYGEKKDYTFINTVQEQSIECVKTLYKNLLNKNVSIDDIMVLSAYNKGEYGTIKLNNAIQEIVNPKLSNSAEMTCRRDNDEVSFRVNDKVIQIKNNYKALTIDGDEVAIFNGDIGTVKQIKKGTLIVDLDGKLIEYDKSQLDELNLAYALSFHKSQGSSSKYVIIITPKAHKFFIDRNLLYVASSRAKHMLYHIGSIDVVGSALKKSQNYSRNTWLKEMLVS